MRVTARVDYAVRALVELAAEGGGPVKLAALAEAQAIPPRFLEHILTDLRRAGLLATQRGAEGGYRLARPAVDISMADVIRALEGPLANVQGSPPELVHHPGPAAPMRDVWVATRAALREVLEAVSVADVATGELPDAVRERTADADAWSRR